MNENQKVNETLQKEIRKVEKIAKKRQVFFPVVNGDVVESQELTFEFHDKVNKMYDGEKAPLRKIMDTYTLDDVNITDPLHKQMHVAATFTNLMYTQIYSSIASVYKKYQLMMLNDQDLVFTLKQLDEYNSAGSNRLYRGGSLNIILERVFAIPYDIRQLSFINGDMYSDNYTYINDITNIRSYFIGDITLIENYTVSLTSLLYKRLKVDLIDYLMFDYNNQKENEVFIEVLKSFNDYIVKIVSELYDVLYKNISDAYVTANKYKEACNFNLTEGITVKVLSSEELSKIVEVDTQEIEESINKEEE